MKIVKLDRLGFGLRVVLLACFATLLAGLSASVLNLEIENSSIERDVALMPQSYSKMLQNATPSVVSVYTARIVKVANSGGYSPEDELLRRFFGIPSPRRDERIAEPEERRVPQGVGSGVVVSADGYIVTNNHVVVDQSGDDADEILVRLNDGRELKAEIVGRDALTDVAVLKVDSSDLPSIKIADSDNIAVGDVVFAIGNPMGVGLTVTQGIVSATHRTIGIYGENGYENFIQTDASINPGNSGGALIDSKGRLIGINSAILSQSGGNIGIGFAIPSNLAVNISRQLAGEGEVRRGFLGVSISDLTPDMAEAFGIDQSKGVLINDVEEDSAADEGGLERGDVVVEIDGKQVESANDFRIKVGNSIPDSEIALEVIRDGKRKTLKMIVGKSAGRFAASANELLDGVAVKELDDELAEHYRIPDGVAGLVITSVAADSPYARNFSEGMVILEVNDDELRSVHEAREKLRSGMNKLYMFSRGRTGYLAVRVD